MADLLIGLAGSGKTHRCVQFSRQSLADGKELIYLVPNREEAGLVRRRLLDAAGDEALFLPGIHYFSSLIARILDSALPGWSLRTSLSRRLQIRRLLDDRRQDLGPLAASSKTPGFLAALTQLFRELEEGAVPPEILSEIGADSPRLSHLASLFDRFSRAQAESLQLDETQAMARAADLLQSRPEDFRALLGVDFALVIDGFSDFSPLQLRFLDALVPLASQALITLNMDPEDLDQEARPPFERVRCLALRFAARPGFKLLPCEDARRFQTPFLGETARSLFRRLPGDAATEPGEALTLVEAATRRDEVEGIVREIRNTLAAGTPADAVAVYYWHDAYGELLSEQLEKEGLPFRCVLRPPLIQNAAVDALLALLDWGVESGPPRDFPQRLRGGYLSLADTLLAELLAESRARGVPGSVSWDELLAEFREASPDAGWDWLDWKESLPEGKLEAGLFLKEVLRPLVTLIAGNLATRFSVRVTDDTALDEALREAALDLPALGQALNAAETVFRELSREDAPRRSAKGWAAQFRAALEAELLTRTRGQEGGGVHLGRPRDLRVPELHTVFVCGLNQGVFPPAFAERPLLREAERRALNERLGENAGLIDWQDEQADARYHFYVAVTRASHRLVLSWSQRDTQGRPALPSYYLEEIKRLCGELPEPVYVPHLGMEQKLRDPLDTRALARDTLLARRRKEAEPLIPGAERWLESNAYADHLVQARADRLETDLDGHPALAPHLEGLDRFSASQLESYAQCPYRFLMEKLLGLEEEEDYEAGAREEGSYYHKILELFFRAWDGDCSIDDEQLEQKLGELDEEAVALLAEEERAFHSPRFLAERPRRLRVLKAFLGKDLDRLGRTDYRPDIAGLEQFFSLKSEALPGESQGRPFELRGFVDRVDVKPDGKRLVLDYKRSEKHSESPSAENPRLYQLALYAIAQGNQALGAAYCALRGKKPLRGYFSAASKSELGEWTVQSRAPHLSGGHWLDEDQWRAWLLNVADSLRDQVEQIRAGHFGAAPVDGEDTCVFCDFSQLCRWRADEAHTEGAS